MSSVSKIKNDGVLYDIEDSTARADISDLKSQISLLSGVPTAVKNALDTLLQNVAFKNTDVYTDELAVVHNWATAVNLISISAVYTQNRAVMETETLDSLKTDLVVTAHYDNGTSEAITNYILVGTLVEGTSQITVNYDGKSTAFSVIVTAWTLKWSYIDGDFPYVTAPNDWTDISQYTSGQTEITFVPNEGVRYYALQGGFGVTPKNYTVTNKGIMEVVANFEALNDFSSIRATLSDSSCIIGFLTKAGVRINGSTYDPIAGTSIATGIDYTLRVVRNGSTGEVYVDGRKVWTGDARVLTGTNNILMSNSGKSSTRTIGYVKEIRFLHEE